MKEDALPHACGGVVLAALKRFFVQPNRSVSK